MLRKCDPILIWNIVYITRKIYVEKATYQLTHKCSKYQESNFIGIFFHAKKLNKRQINTHPLVLVIVHNPQASNWSITWSSMHLVWYMWGRTPIIFLVLRKTLPGDITWGCYLDLYAFSLVYVRSYYYENKAYLKKKKTFMKIEDF